MPPYGQPRPHEDDDAPQDGQGNAEAPEGLDLLAERSTIFDQHYTPCPLCVPGRTSVMTGLCALCRATSIK